MKRIVFLLSVLSLLSSYSLKAQQPKVISPTAFSDSLQTKQNFVLLDVRTPEEFNEGHLKNALNVDFKTPNFKTQVDALDKNKTYYVYCRSGKRSAAAVAQMRTLGFKNIYELEGGMLKWVAEGMQTVKEISE